MICLLLILENGGLTTCDLKDRKCHSLKLVPTFSLKRPGINVLLLSTLKKTSSLKLVIYYNAIVLIAAILRRKKKKNQTCKNLFQAKLPLNSRIKSIKH